jgi:hypothetical protein
VGPVLKNRLIDALGSMQVLAPVVGNSGPQNVVMAPLDHVDRVYLHIAEMSDRSGRRRRSRSEWSWPVEPLGTKPDPPGLSRCEEERRAASSRPKRTFLAGRPSLWHRTRAATRRTTGLHVRARHLRPQRDQVPLFPLSASPERLGRRDARSVSGKRSSRPDPKA